jgi:hypothetical protein
MTRKRPRKRPANVTAVGTTVWRVAHRTVECMNACLRDRCLDPALAGGRLCHEHWHQRTLEGVELLDAGALPLPAGLVRPGVLVVRLRAREATRVIGHREIHREVLSIYDPPHLVGRLTFRTSVTDEGPRVRIRLLETSRRYRRQGVASALYDVLRVLHPDTAVDHGVRTAAGARWWPSYCKTRGLDPTDPQS